MEVPTFSLWITNKLLRVVLLSIFFPLAQLFALDTVNFYQVFLDIRTTYSTAMRKKVVLLVRCPQLIHCSIATVMVKISGLIRLKCPMGGVEDRDSDDVQVDEEEPSSDDVVREKKRKVCRHEYLFHNA